MKKEYDINFAIEEGKKYCSRREFRSCSFSAFYFLQKLDLLHLIFPLRKHPPGYWTKEKCTQEALKYRNIAQFQKESKGAYASALKHGWVKDVSVHMEKLHFFSFEDCKTEALKYNRRIDFNKLSPLHYNKARTQGWLSDICSHMVLGKRQWDKESAFIEAKKYTCRKDFNRHSSGAANYLRRLCLLDEACKGYITNRPKKGFLNKESCRLEALKFNNRNEFAKNLTSSPFYRKAHREGWLDDICSHMPDTYKQITLEECKVEALKYDYKKDFREKAQRYWKRATRKGWMDQICSHMKAIGSRYKRLIYVYEFSDKSVYVGLTYNEKQRNWSHLKGKKKEHSAVYQHFIKSGLSPIYKRVTNYIDVNEARKIEGETVEDYRKNGWNILNKVKTGGLGAVEIFWTKELCAKEAAKFNRKSDFAKTHSAAYAKSREFGWWDEISSHMKVNKKPSGYWINNKERCFNEAVKYKTRNEFRIESPSAYSTGYKMGWLADMCRHMPKRAKGNRI